MIESLAPRARDIAFPQLVRLLLRGRPAGAAPGGPGPARREFVRFRAAVSLAFPGCDVAAVDTVADSDDPSIVRARVTVNFLGLQGPSSPLPSHITEELLWTSEETDRGAVRDFLDLFNHRFISFVYAGWEKYRHPMRWNGSGTDEVTARVLALLGLGGPALRERSGIDVRELLRVAGPLSSRHRSAAGLECAVRARFPGVEARVESCVPRWAPIPRQQQLRLGGAARLGDDTCLGESVRDRAGAFRVHLGPLGLEAFRAFLPGGADLGHLARLVRLYAREPLDFDVALRLRADEVPALRLDPGARLGLGRLTWLSPRAEREGRAIVNTKQDDPLAALSAAPTGRH